METMLLTRRHCKAVSIRLALHSEINGKVQLDTIAAFYISESPGGCRKSGCDTASMRRLIECGGTVHLKVVLPVDLERHNIALTRKLMWRHATLGPYHILS